MKIGKAIENANEAIFTLMYSKCYQGIAFSVGIEIWDDLNIVMWDELVNKVGVVSDNLYIKLAKSWI